MSTITRFQIKNLYGYKTFDLKIKDNTIVLVGENGSGKTTILRLFYYFLSGQWNALANYKFDELEVTINGKSHIVLYNQLEQTIIPRILENSKIINRLHPVRRRRLIQALTQKNSISFSELESICNEYDLPFQYIVHELDKNAYDTYQEKLKKIFDEVRQSFNTELLFLPTYRRIEQELFQIIKGADTENLRLKYQENISEEKEKEPFVELIEFGMKDVESDINRTLRTINIFAWEKLNDLSLGYLGEVIDKKYLDVEVEKIQSVPNETIETILNRIDDHFLSAKQKVNLKNTIQKVKQKKKTSGAQEKIVCHYFNKLLEFQQVLQERELKMTRFCDVCNEYLVNKSFVYDRVKFEFSIQITHGDSVQKEIELKHLSSGEKQIVSLFSHLYLSGKHKYVVIIDEPEMSLSVPWQRKFLMDIKKGEFCSGLIAATHSPFIYDNELREYAHGLGEFLS